MNKKQLTIFTRFAIWILKVTGYQLQPNQLTSSSVTYLDTQKAMIIRSGNTALVLKFTNAAASIFKLGELLPRPLDTSELSATFFPSRMMNGRSLLSDYFVMEKKTKPEKV